MKRITLILVLVFLFSPASLAEAPVKAEIEATAEPGSWENVPHEPVELPADAQAAFDRALEGLVGAQYTPVVLLSTRTDAGTHYCILCQIMPVVPDAVASWTLVYIHADSKGNAEITNTYELYIERHSMP